MTLNFGNYKIRTPYMGWPRMLDLRYAFYLLNLCGIYVFFTVQGVARKKDTHLN